MTRRRNDDKEHTAESKEPREFRQLTRGEDVAEHVNGRVRAREAVAHSGDDTLSGVIALRRQPHGISRHVQTQVRGSAVGEECVEPLVQLAQVLALTAPGIKHRPRCRMTVPSQRAKVLACCRRERVGQRAIIATVQKPPTCQQHRTTIAEQRRAAASGTPEMNIARAGDIEGVPVGTPQGLTGSRQPRLAVRTHKA